MHKRRGLFFFLICIHALVFLDFERMERILVNEKKTTTETIKKCNPVLEYKVEANVSKVAIFHL